MATYLITGATSGIGLQVGLRLAKEGRHRLILPARNSQRAEELRQSLGDTRNTLVSTPIMDLASLQSVSAYLQAFHADPTVELDGVLLNAGVQSSDKIEFTVDGFESTFAVNHLAHLHLIQGLIGSLAQDAVVGWTASGVHDPAEKSARLFGLRGEQYTSAARLAKGDFEPGISVAQACRDAYATSKFCNVVSARAFAKLLPTAATYFSYDPGLMPGTGLSRKHGRIAQWVWHNVLPGLAAVLPQATTPEKSSGTLTRLLTGQLRGSYNGAYFNFTGRQREPAVRAAESWVAEDLMTFSNSLLAPFDRKTEVQRVAARHAGKLTLATA